MGTDQTVPLDQDDHRWTRRRVLAWGLGTVAVVAAAGVVGVELVEHGVLPGKGALDAVDGACSVPRPPVSFGPLDQLGPAVDGRFYSRARHRAVGYTIAYPPGHGRGSALPLVVMLHGFGGNHTDALADISPQQAVAMRIGGQPLPPMALVTVDGGGGYWNAHPGDDPQAMVVDELIPLCQSLGLGRSPQRIGVMGISMGGYGALLFGEKHPELFAAVAAISPAVWTSYGQAHAANAGAYASAADFAADDVVTHASALAGTPVRVASGLDDPFHPGVETLVRALPAGAVVAISRGCHTGPFFTAQQPPSLAFLARHLHAA